MDTHAASVFLGNALTLAFLWGCVQFHRHDYKAPWLAYAATLMPIGYFILVVVSTEVLPQSRDASDLQQAVALSQ